MAASLELTLSRSGTIKQRLEKETTTTSSFAKVVQKALLIIETPALCFAPINAGSVGGEIKTIAMTVSATVKTRQPIITGGPIENALCRRRSMSMVLLAWFTRGASPPVVLASIQVIGS